MKNPKSHLFMLLLAAFLWGTTFAAQSIGADYVGPFTYLMGRSWIAVIFLTPIIFALDKLNDNKGKISRRPKCRADRLKIASFGVISGTFLLAGSALQQMGMGYTTASKASFITSLYVIIVPVIGIFFKKRPGLRIWLCVLVAMVGMYLLCMSGESFTLQKGDALVLASAFTFSADIMVLAYFSSRVDGVRLSRMQFFVVAVESTIGMLLTETFDPTLFIKALPAVAYAGIFSSGIAYTFQILGQEDVETTLASLLMSLESVFGALSGWIILHEEMTSKELLGCLLMFAAIVAAQIEEKPAFLRKKKTE